jgi:hypothetical protein
LSRKPSSSRSRLAVAGWGILLLAIIVVAALALYTGLTPSQRPQAVANSPEASNASGQATVSEEAVQEIPLSGPIAKAEAEVSGLGWYGDTLIILPQFPKRMSKKANGALFALPKVEIIQALQGQGSLPLSPREIPLDSGGLEGNIPGFEGFEAIDFLGDQIFLTIEAHAVAGMSLPGYKAGDMMGYLVSGKIAPDLSEVRLDPDSLVINKPQVNLENKSDEALLIWQSQIFTFYEANGAAVNPAPHATLFSPDLKEVGTLPFPHIEYRITDTATTDSAGRFWAINYFFPDEDYLKAAVDPLALQYGKGPTHAVSDFVERLVKFQITPTGIELSSTPPLQLQLLGDGTARNWEGLAQLDETGFLIATDKYPRTILAFVAASP